MRGFLRKKNDKKSLEKIPSVPNLKYPKCKVLKLKLGFERVDIKLQQALFEVRCPNTNKVSLQQNLPWHHYFPSFE